MSHPKNLLADETSPYLLQHANNPVAWHPWGPEALARARDEDRPILLSIGYAACHWCHVMERECFENEAIAQLMNASFVCIKVDREERPDLDEIYMAATVAMSGSGGWPMTVFLTPDQKPFFAGTYFPPDDRHGRPGFPTLLTKIAEMWVSDRRSLLSQADELTAYVRAHAAVSQPSAISRDATDAAVAQLAASFDPRWGGFGGAPKFPPSSALMLLLASYQRTRDAETLRLVTKTLDGMKNGGMYDHVAGGFCRYSTDERWLVPHFEKMLYDNAQLSRVYLAAWQVTRDPEYRRVAQETYDYVIREMQAPEGGYYSATDADSEGEEGKFFVWHPDELVAVLGPDRAESFATFYDITELGNWEGKSIPNTPRELTEVARELGRDSEAVLGELTEAKRLVYEARRERPQPLLDDKLLGAWNGLMLGAMAEGFRVLRDERYLDSATRAAVAMQNTLLRTDGGLYRTARAGRAHKEAVLEDYAYLADGLLDLYEAGGDDAWLALAAKLAERALRDFSDEESGAFHHTAADHEPLIARMREGHDGALPNASAVLARALLRLGRQLGRPEWVARAERTLAAYGREIQRIPRAFCTALGVAECLFEPAVELVIRGEATDPAREALLAAIAPHYLPNRVIAYASTDHPAASPDARPLLQGKTTDGRAALFVCRNYTCLAPVYEASAVAEALAANDQTRAADRSHRIGDFRMPGRATQEGTTRYAARFAEGKFASLGELTVSRLGFGGYRIDDETPEHRAALTAALTAGVNLIDTSTNYSDGQSERLVGQVLRSLIESEQLLREEVVVVSKMGYVQGANLDRVNERKAAQNPYPEVVELGPGLKHCIHPDWLAEQLEESLSRVGLEHLDVCLLHNPEYFLTHAAKEGRMSLTEARDEFYRRLTQAFAFLESAVKDGRIGCYGVSSNTVTAAQDDREATDLSRILDAARRAGGETHGFRVVQLPMNLMETGAVFEQNTQGGAHSALSFAKEHDLAVLVNRPLNAITPSGLCRLADPPLLAGTPPVETLLGKVAALELEFRQTFAPSIRTGPDGPAPETLLDWASQLAELPAQVKNLAAWTDLEAQVIAPRTKHVLNALTSAMRGALQSQFADFRQRYEEALQTLCLALAARAAQVSRSEALGATRLVDPLLPAARRQEPLSQKALAVLLGTGGVTSVLVGMRRPEYVTDAVAIMTWPATSGLEALRSA